MANDFTVSSSGLGVAVIVQDGRAFGITGKLSVASGAYLRFVGDAHIRLSGSETAVNGVLNIGNDGTGTPIKLYTNNSNGYIFSGSGTMNILKGATLGIGFDNSESSSVVTSSLKMAFSDDSTLVLTGTLNQSASTTFGNVNISAAQAGNTITANFSGTLQIGRAHV